MNTIISQLNAISWREPLWLLATLPVFFYWLRSVSRLQQTPYAETHLMPWALMQNETSLRQRWLSKNSAYVVAWLLLAIAAAGPRLPLGQISPEQATNLDIMLVADVSRSMQVTDINPSRLRRVHIEIEELLARTHGNRVGIIVFAARPHLLVPLTSDMSALRFYLQTLDTLVLPTSGSEPVAALALAEDELHDSTNPSAMILFSDGDFPTDQQPASLTTTPLYILGVGSTEGAAIPLENGQWLQHEGRPVISRLNEKTLHTFIGENSHRYSAVTDDDRDWQQLYDNSIARLSNKTIDDDAEHNIIWQQLYHWPLSVALLLIWVSLTPYGLRARTKTIPLTRTTPPQSTINAAAKTLLIFSGIGLFALSLFQPTLANSVMKNSVSPNQAYKNYANGNYSSAITIYKQLTGYTARFGEAASHYKSENYNDAIRQFSRAVLAAKNDQQSAAALFNLGNSYFQTGNYTAAVSVYTDALKYQPTHKNTQHNLQFSNALRIAVDERLQKSRKATRMGLGPQLAPSSEALDANQGGSMAIDGNNAEDVKTFPLPELADLSSNALEELINKGLAQIKLAASSANVRKNQDYQRNQIAFITARLRMQELNDQQSLMWKYLFEMEEGFPAPLAEPRQIPGVPAW